MADFLAITFDGTDDAEAALKSIRALEGDGRIKLEDTAVVRKDAAGKVTIHNEAVERHGDRRGRRRRARRAAVRGVPAGRGRGRRRRRAVLIGRAAAPGIDGAFVKEVGDDLPPGGSALFLQIKGGDTGCSSVPCGSITAASVRRRCPTRSRRRSTSRFAESCGRRPGRPRGPGLTGWARSPPIADCSPTDH